MAVTEISSSKKIIISSHSLIRRRKATNQIMLVITGLMVILAIIPLIWIIVYVFIKGSQAINLDFFTKLPTILGQVGGGILHAIEGTIILAIISAIIAIPIGVLTALYVVRHPNTIIGTQVRFGTDVLSGIPSIVVGIFCYAFVVKVQGHFSALAGGIALAILMLPIIIRTTEEMIKLVPADLREASLALGAPEWKTALTVLLPAAVNGIVTGFMLGIARASGETAPLLFTALGNENFNIVQIFQSGMAQKQNVFTIIGRIINSPVDSLPLTLYKYTSLPYPERITQAWGVALVLLAMILILNISAKMYVLYRESKMKGK
jgi:phosphate transport system permease protein